MNRTIKIFLSIVFVLLALILPLSGINIRAENEIIKQLSDGLAKESEGDYISAIFIYQDILKKNRYFLNAKIALARCYIKTGNLKEAENLLLDSLKQNKKNVDVLNLLGRVYISQKKYNEAQQSFMTVIDIEPINIEARYGLADLYRKKGDYQKAIEMYNEMLKIYPRDVWTYIYLGIAYTDMGNLSRAGGFFRKAVSLDSQSKWTHINLAHHYYRRGVEYSKKDTTSSNKYFDAAIYEANTSLLIDKDFKEALGVLSDVYFYKGDYRNVVSTIKKLIEQGEDNRILYYEMGFCYEMLNKYDDAIDAYSKAVYKGIYDEVARYRLENVVLLSRRENITDRKRIELSRFHFDKGKFYLNKNLLDKAFIKYKRSVQLDPVSSEKRLELVEMYKLKHFNELYLYELKDVIRDTLDVNTLDINDRIEIYENKILRNIANRWNVKQYIDDENSFYYFPKTKTKIAVFDYFLSDYIKENFIHKRLSKTLKEMIEDILSNCPKIDVISTKSKVNQESDALKLARSLDLDFYIIGKVDEKDSSIKLETNMVSGFNGKVIKEFKTYFTGNDKIFNAVFSISQKIIQSVPLRGMIIRIEGQRVLINIGKAHGVKKDMDFLIFRGGGLRNNPETGEFVMDPEIVLGELKIIDVDEMVSEGEYIYKGIYNRVNINDNVILIEEKKDKEKKSEETIKK